MCAVQIHDGRTLSDGLSVAVLLGGGVGVDYHFQSKKVFQRIVGSRKVSDLCRVVARSFLPPGDRSVVR